MINSGQTILIVEDERSIAELIAYNLTSAGFKTLLAEDGQIGLSMAKDCQPDLLLLDWMLPGLTGLEICEQIRLDTATRNIPIIMLTSRGEEADKISGLNVGADDYITKPFSPAELVARISAVLRRTTPKLKGQSLKLGPLFIDLMQRKVFLNGQDVHLGPTEFRLLHHFMQHPGEVFSREQLLEQVWERIFTSNCEL